MIYVLPFKNIATGASGDVYQTMAAIVVPDTAGSRARIRRVFVGPADDTPLDNNISLLIKRIASVSGGTAGTSTAITPPNLPKVDPDGPDWLGNSQVAYTVEPTTYETNELWVGDEHIKGYVDYPFLHEKEMPRANRNMLLGLLAAPRVNTAIRISGHIVFERF